MQESGSPGHLGNESKPNEAHSGAGNAGSKSLFSFKPPQIPQVYLYVLLAFAALFSFFLVLQNVDFVLENWFWVLLFLALLYLIATYDYILQLTSFERAVIFTLGQISRVGGPGWTIVFPPLESFTKVDLRTHLVDIPPQNVVTKDGVEVKIDALLYLKVRKDKESVIKSVVEVEDYNNAARQLVIGLLRDRAGSLDLNELISTIEDVNHHIKDELDKIAQKWGVEVEEVTIHAVDIPKTVLDAMHEQKAAIQRKLARFESIEGHKAEIEAIKSAAENLSDKAISYYYIKALEKLGEGASTKFIFPLELSRLAESIGGKNMSSSEIEGLLKKYAPVLKSLVTEKKKKGGK